MKKTFNILFLSLIFSYFTIDAKILEIKNISELTQYTKDKNSLIVFDIDNTVLEPNNETGYGSDQWFSALVKSKTDKGFSTLTAIEKVLPTYYKAHETMNVKPVEADSTLEIIKKLQQQKIPVMALTARSLPMINTTIRQFKEMNLDLSPTSPSKQMIIFKKCEFPAKYKNGILFVGNNNKGELLKTYLSTINFKPSKIIIIDDKRKHLESAESEFKNSPKISFLGLRYSFLDEKVKNFVLNENANEASIFTKIKNSLFNMITKVTDLLKGPFKSQKAA